MAESGSARHISPISIAGRPIMGLILPIPVVCFLGALLTDWAYVRSGGNFLWINFSSWLLTAGLLAAGLAIVLILIEIIRIPAIRAALGWSTLGLLVAAWLTELINALVHTRDGWTAVVPTGLTLSIIGVLLLLAGGWFWQSIRLSSGEAR